MFGQRLISQVKKCLKKALVQPSSSTTTWIHVEILHQTACSASRAPVQPQAQQFSASARSIDLIILQFERTHIPFSISYELLLPTTLTMNLRLATWLLATTTALMPSTASAAGVRGKDDQDKQQRRVLQEGQPATYLVQDNEYEHDETGRRLNLFGNSPVPEKINTVELSNHLIYKVEGSMPPGWQRSGQDVFLPPATIIDDLTATITLPNSNGKGKGNGRYLQGEADAIPKVASTLTEDQERNLSELNRQLAVVTGQKTVLAVKVVLSDAAYGFDASYLECKVFGTSNGVDCGDTLHLTNAYSACSFGKLQFGKAADRTTGSGTVSDISNGVVTVTLPAFSTSQGDGTVRNEVTKALNAAFGSATSLANHLMYCMPPGTMGGEYLPEIYIYCMPRAYSFCAHHANNIPTSPRH